MSESIYFLKCELASEMLLLAVSSNSSLTMPTSCVVVYSGSHAVSTLQHPSYILAFTPFTVFSEHILFSSFKHNTAAHDGGLQEYPTTLLTIQNDPLLR